VSHFPTAKTQRDFRLVAIFEEAREVTQFHVVVTVVGARPEFDFLDLNDLLLEFRLVLLLGFRVLELAVIHQPGNRRDSLRRDFDEIHVLLLRHAESIGKLHDS